MNNKNPSASGGKDFNPKDVAIGKNLGQLRAKRGMSQTDLSRSMNARGWNKWSQSTVWAVESGARPLRLAETIDLSSILGLEDVTPIASLINPELSAAYSTYNAARHAAENAVQELVQSIVNVAITADSADEVTPYDDKYIRKYLGRTIPGDLLSDAINRVRLRSEKGAKDLNGKYSQIVVQALIEVNEKLSEHFVDASVILDE